MKSSERHKYTPRKKDPYAAAITQLVKDGAEVVDVRLKAYHGRTIRILVPVMDGVDWNDRDTREAALDYVFNEGRRLVTELYDS